MIERKARRLSVGMRVAFGCFVIAGSWRCSLLVDTSGLSSPPGPPTDGGSPTSDGEVGAAPVDAQADAEGGFRDCVATPHELCDDFDNGLLGARWSGQAVDHGGALALTDAALSPPFALHASLVPLPSGAGAAALYRDIERSASVVSCELDVEVLAGFFQIFDVSFSTQGSSTSNYGVAINFAKTSEGAHLREYAISASNVYAVLHEYALPGMPVSVWHHASFVVSITTAGAGSAKLAIDGVSVVDVPLTPTKELLLSRLTLSENFTSSPFDALFDNVYCDIR